MLRLNTIADTGTGVAYSIRRWSDGAAYDPARNSFAAAGPPTPLPAMAEGKAPDLGRFTATIATASTASWADGIYEVLFHDAATQEVFDGALVEMIAGDDMPPRHRPEVPPPGPPIVPPVVNGGFGLPAIPPKTVVDAPPDGWMAAGPVQHASNGSPGVEGNSPAPDEGQFLSLPGGSTLSQAIPNWAAGRYAVYLKFAMKSGSKAHRFSVLVDGEVIVDGTLAATYSLARLDWSGIMTPAFNVEAGDHTLAFAGDATAGAGSASLIDRVQVVRIS